MQVRLTDCELFGTVSMQAAPDTAFTAKPGSKYTLDIRFLIFESDNFFVFTTAIGFSAISVNSV
jgi:hypothetical protein